MSDALFGPDGTQAPPPPPAYRDALSVPLQGSKSTSFSPSPERTATAAPVKASKPSPRMRQAMTDARRRPAAAPQTGAVPTAYSAPQRVGPAKRLAATPRRTRTGVAVTWWLILLLIFGSLAFNVLHGVLRDLGILR